MKLFPKPKLTDLLIIAAIMALFGLTGCAKDQIQKAQAAVTTLQGDGVKLQADEATAAPLVAAVSGWNQKLSNDLAYASAITQDVQTFGPLLSDLLTLIPTTGSTASAYPGHYWTHKGMLALTQHHIKPMDRYALQKLALAVKMPG